MHVSSGLTRVLGSSWLLGAVVGLVSWPGLLVTPGVGLDPSWGTALNMASAQGLDFGGDVIWTYGPLGFLKVPQVTYGTYAVLGAGYTIAVQIALGTTLVWSARRTFPLPIAVAIALLAAMLLIEPIVAIALIWCVIVLGDEPPPAAGRLFPLAAGIVSAVELLGKLNIGLLVVAMCGVSVVAMDGARRRNALTFGASLALALAVLWFGTGQGLGDLGDEVSASVGIVTGYSTALARENAPSGSLYAWSLALLVTSILAAYVGGRDLPFGRRVATLIVVGLAGVRALGSRRSYATSSRGRSACSRSSSERCSRFRGAIIDWGVWTMGGSPRGRRSPPCWPRLPPTSSLPRGSSVTDSTRSNARIGRSRRSAISSSPESAGKRETHRDS